MGGRAKKTRGRCESPNGFTSIVDGRSLALGGEGPLTINGTYLSDLNSQTNLLGTITNNGDIQVNGGASTNTLLNIGSNVTLQGPGTVTLSTATGSGAAIIEQRDRKSTRLNSSPTSISYAVF